jgi:lipopolysaccharide export system protein LptA
VAGSRETGNTHTSASLMIIPCRPASRRRLLNASALLGALLASDVTVAAAQMDGCEFGSKGRNDGIFRTLPQIGPVWYIGGPHFVCADGVEIFADSVVSYENRGMQDLIGRVRYLSPGRELRADEARYFQREGRLQANGNVSIRDDEGGSTIDNGNLVLLLVTDFRDEEEMTVSTAGDGIRPVARLAPPPLTAELPEEVARGDSTAITEARPPVPGETASTEPYRVVSDRMFLRGGGYFAAAGSVEIERDSLFAWADSAEYDQAGGGLNLEGGGRVESAAYQLEGQSIQMGSPGAATNQVRATRDAKLVGNDLELTAAQIRMFLREGALERLVARSLHRVDGEGSSSDAERPEAIIKTFRLTADSLEVIAPNERLERVLASGSARSVSTSGDTLNVEVLPDVALWDWLEGDTIVVTFAPRDEGADDGQMDVEHIIALAGARSLYRLPPNDSSAVTGTDPPAVHYVTGTEIRIDMDAGQVSGMQVAGQTRGVHLEPLILPPPPADTALVGPDSAGAAADTSEVVQDTTAMDTVSSDDPLEIQSSGSGQEPHQREERSEPAKETPPREDAPWTQS